MRHVIALSPKIKYNNVPTTIEKSPERNPANLVFLLTSARSILRVVNNNSIATKENPGLVIRK